VGLLVLFCVLYYLFFCVIDGGIFLYEAMYSNRFVFFVDLFFQIMSNNTTNSDILDSCTTLYDVHLPPYYVPILGILMSVIGSFIMSQCCLWFDTTCCGDTIRHLSNDIAEARGQMTSREKNYLDTKQYETEKKALDQAQSKYEELMQSLQNDCHQPILLLYYHLKHILSVAPKMFFHHFKFGPFYVVMRSWAHLALHVYFIYESIRVNQAFWDIWPYYLVRVGNSGIPLTFVIYYSQIQRIRSQNPILFWLQFVNLIFLVLSFIPVIQLYLWLILIFYIILNFYIYYMFRKFSSHAQFFLLVPINFVGLCFMVVGVSFFTNNFVLCLFVEKNYNVFLQEFRMRNDACFFDETWNTLDQNFIFASFV